VARRKPVLQEIVSYVDLSRKGKQRVNLIWVVAEPRKVVTNLRAKEQR
jgi:hypothetical protein